MKKKILVILGPTASGKSDLAVKLAKKFNGEVISADSRQVYKGLDVGSGKITQKEMRGVPHHLLDVANPRKQFSVAQYKILGRKKLTEINFPIIVGGTGFYIDVLTGKINLPDVPPNKELRKKLGEKSAKELSKLLKKKDPKRAGTIDPCNKVRLIRALEIVKALGCVPKIRSQNLEAINFIYIGLKPDNLDKRIYDRLIKRMPKIIAECRKLHKNGLSWKRMYELGLEYRYIGMYLQNKIDKKEMTGKLYTEIRRYAKRQMTWFKRNKKIKWFTLNAVEGFRPEEYKKIEKYLKNQIGGR